MASHLMNIINLGNSIIGVSILAMPYCFQKCGILLSLLLIIVSGILVRSACYLLLKGAIMARRRNFAFLAFHAFGSSGKLAVEIGIIGFLIGVCIAFFVVIGDLGPPLASQYLFTENTPNLRVMLLVMLGFFVALPLGLLRKVDSLTSLSALSIAFYGWLVLKIFSEASAQLIANEWWHKVNWWQPAGLLPCLPIFSMALSCQTQLFEFFDTLSEPSLKRMMSVVSGAVFLCSSVYILVGIFGYIACHDQVITGNILVNLTPSIMTECIKFGFIFTLAISFPLCLFPCRTSLHSLLFKQAHGHHDIAANFIPDQRFRLLTVSLVIVTIGVAIMIPSIEFVLGIIGSTIGTAICLIFPAVIFIHDTSKNTTEKRVAQIVMCIGMFILVACTYSTLQEGTQTKRQVSELPLPRQTMIKESLPENKVVSDMPFLQDKVMPAKKESKISEKMKIIEKELEAKKDTANIGEIRQEPPIPHESDAKLEKVNPGGDLDPQALQKEDKEIQKNNIMNSLTSASSMDIVLKEKQELLIRKLEEQNKEQKLLIEEQKKVLQEMRQHQEIHGEKVGYDLSKSTASINQIEGKLQINIDKDKQLSAKISLIDIQPVENKINNIDQSNVEVNEPVKIDDPKQHREINLSINKEKTNKSYNSEPKKIISPNLIESLSEVKPLRQGSVILPNKEAFKSPENLNNEQIKRTSNTSQLKKSVDGVEKMNSPNVNLPNSKGSAILPGSVSKQQMKTLQESNGKIKHSPNVVANVVSGSKMKENPLDKGGVFSLKLNSINESLKMSPEALEEKEKHEMRR